MLISARDPGAAGSVGPLARAFRADGRLEVEITASGKALEMLRAEGESPTAFAFGHGLDSVPHGEDAGPLLAEARRLIERIQPDAVLVSLSTSGTGVDEALLATAEVPTFAMQDFWGEANLGLGVGAGLYFALDDFAVGLTNKRWGLGALSVGSPKHVEYAALDVLELRQRARGELGAGDDTALVGYFGQSPDAPGVGSAFRDLVEAVASLERAPIFLMREHPKYPDARERHAALARDRGLAVADVTAEPSAEPWLAACDVVTASLSLCGLDHAYLSAYSPRPIGVVIYLMMNAEIRDYAQRSCGIPRLPMADQGLGLVAADPAQLLTQLERGLSLDERKSYFKASKRLGKTDPCGAIVSAVTSAVLKHSTSALGARTPA